MKYLYLPLFFLTFLALTCFAQSSLDAGLIEDSLKTNANAVIRFSNTSYEHISAEKYRMRVHYAITVLNEKGKSSSGLTAFYDGNSEISRISIYLYDSKGKLLGKKKKKDIRDYPANQSFTIFSESRVKVFRPAVHTYPYTIEYDYTVEYTGLVGFDIWLPQEEYNISTQKAELTYSTNNENDIKFKMLNHDFEFNTQVVDGVTTYRWSACGLKAIEKEPGMPNYLNVFPTVLLSPNIIEYLDTQGDFSDWRSYGEWVYNLLEGRDMLSEETVLAMKALTDNISSEREKVKAIYEYMQGKTRYVNIVLGLGGFQPMLASEVDEKGFGDCKALSNYTKALLNAVGIKSFYTEIGNGNRQMIKFPDFASANQTNHIILCVPLKEDTVWLECTSQNIPFGYIGRGNSDRYALLITSEGGVLAKTPYYSAESNLRNSTINLTLSPDGSCDFNLQSNYSDLLFEEIFGLLKRSEKEQREYLLEQLSAEGLSLGKIALKENDLKCAQGSMNLDGHINKYATKTGTRLFIKPNYLLKESVLETVSNTRKQDIFQEFGFTINDTLNLKIPEVYKFEHIPADIVYSSVYGDYSISFKSTEDNVQIVRTLIINQGDYKPNSFDEIRIFLKNISQKDNENIILVNN